MTAHVESTTISAREFAVALGTACRLGRGYLACCPLLIEHANEEPNFRIAESDGRIVYWCDSHWNDNARIVEAIKTRWPNVNAIVGTFTILDDDGDPPPGQPTIREIAEPPGMPIIADDDLPDTSWLTELVYDASHPEICGLVNAVVTFYSNDGRLVFRDEAPVEQPEGPQDPPTPPLLPAYSLWSGTDVLLPEELTDVKQGLLADGLTEQKLEQSKINIDAAAYRLSTIATLAKMPKLEREPLLKSTAKRLGLKISTLNEEIRKKRAERGENASNSSNSRTPTPETLGAVGVEGSSNGSSNTPPVRTVDELYTAAKDLIEARDVLTRVRDMVGRLGYAGDPTPVLLTYVVLTSRLGEKPINEHVNAQSAAGKNYTVNIALALVPDEAVFKMTASSPKALIYSEEDLRHRIVVLGECDSLLALEGNAATLVRSIIEDARTDYDVVEKDPETGHSATRRVSKEGPTGLITTGVRDLEIQTSTRMLNVYLPDGPEHPRRSPSGSR